MISDGDARIVIWRGRRWPGKWVKWTVFIDGDSVGKIGDGDSMTKVVPAGTHAVAVGSTSDGETLVNIPSGSFVEFFVGAPERRLQQQGPAWRGRPALRVYRLGPGAAER
ncbi:MAG: hypothetical protein AB7U39_21085 [Ilumatobacteraceae bacterium]